MFMMWQYTQYFVADDTETFDHKSEQLEKVEQTNVVNWHFLNRFEEYLERYDTAIQKYLKEFRYKFCWLFILKTTLKKITLVVLN